MNLFREESSDHKLDAQRNLEGRSHYVDDDTLRFHHARINHSFYKAGGLLFIILESVAKDYENRSREHRGVIFNVFGKVIYCPKLGEGFKNSNRAWDDVLRELKTIDAKKITREAITHANKWHKIDMLNLRKDMQAIKDI